MPSLDVLSGEKKQPPRICAWCHEPFDTRLYHFEGQVYCSRTCLEKGVAAEVAKPIFQAPQRMDLRQHLRSKVPR